MPLSPTPAATGPPPSASSAPTHGHRCLPHPPHGPRRPHLHGRRRLSPPPHGPTTAVSDVRRMAAAVFRLHHLLRPPPPSFVVGDRESKLAKKEKGEEDRNRGDRRKKE
ncbi:hypothetical protein [Oryza sativa Japonica Group]|uniref:Uncharacterized protein n=1 Tax=Oryza sativa subsp. japonica TaxID=39947 RepID=Q655P3_ORYSJ|nr:hypothetical protein [Oryza sativa Japonica Group]